MLIILNIILYLKNYNLKILIILYKVFITFNLLFGVCLLFLVLFKFLIALIFKFVINLAFRIYMYIYTLYF